MAVPKQIVTGLTILLLITAVMIMSLTKGFESSKSHLRIAYATERPYAYYDQDGNLTGAYVETAEYIASQMGIDSIDWVQIRFDKLISTLRSNHVDVIGSGMFITSEREEKVDFSVPFMTIKSAVIVDTNKVTDIKASDGKNRFTIAVQAASVEASRIKQTQHQNQLLALEVPSTATGIQALKTGLSDGLYLTTPTVEAIQSAHSNRYDIIPESELVGEFKKLGIGFVFNKNDKKLRQQWNSIARDWIGSDQHIKLISHFGFDRRDLP